MGVIKLSELSDAVIASFITSVIALIGVIWTNRKSTAELFAKLDKQSEINDQRLDAKLSQYQAVTDTKIDALTNEVRKHNAFAERIPALEEKAKAADRRLTDLEHKAS